jgi:hypothetical protein
MVLQAPFPLHRLEGVLGLMMVPDGTLAFVVRPVP